LIKPQIWQVSSLNL